MNAEAIQNVLRGSLVSSFCRYFARSLREAAFWTRRPQNTIDLNTPRGSKFALSPARRASFLKITFLSSGLLPGTTREPEERSFWIPFLASGHHLDAETAETTKTTLQKERLRKTTENHKTPRGHKNLIKSYKI